MAAIEPEVVRRHNAIAMALSALGAISVALAAVRFERPEHAVPWAAAACWCLAQSWSSTR